MSKIGKCKNCKWLRITIKNEEAWHDGQFPTAYIQKVKYNMCHANTKPQETELDNFCSHFRGKDGKV